MALSTSEMFEKQKGGPWRWMGVRNGEQWGKRADRCGDAPCQADTGGTLVSLLMKWKPLGSLD